MGTSPRYGTHAASDVESSPTYNYHSDFLSKKLDTSLVQREIKNKKVNFII